MMMKPFFTHFDGEDGIVAQMKNKLAERDLRPGDDILVMVGTRAAFIGI